MQTNIQTFKTFLWDLQNRITKALSKQDGSPFLTDRWEKSTHTQGITGHGNTMILKQGNIIEQGGVNLSIVSGDKLPPSATTKLQLAGCHFEAMGLSPSSHTQATPISPLAMPTSAYSSPTKTTTSSTGGLAVDLTSPPTTHLTKTANIGTT